MEMTSTMSLRHLRLKKQERTLYSSQDTQCLSQSRPISLHLVLYVSEKVVAFQNYRPIATHCHLIYTNHVELLSVDGFFFTDILCRRDASTHIHAEHTQRFDHRLNAQRQKQSFGLFSFYTTLRIVATAAVTGSRKSWIVFKLCRDT